jgi:putative hemolysin
VAVVVILVTFFSLVLGELVPKRLALNNAEKIASSVSPLMHTLSRITNPLVIFLSKSTKLVLRLLGARPSSEPEVTDEDVTSMMHIGAGIGVFEKAEQEMQDP